MTLKLTKEEKEARDKLYKHNYSRMYYQEQREQNNERYKDMLEKARIRYEKKQLEKAIDNPEKKIKKYKKRNIMAEINEPQQVAPAVVENEVT